MSNNNDIAAQIEEARKNIAEEILPAIRELEEAASPQFIAAAKADGYSDEQAANVDLLARVPLIQGAVDGLPPAESIQNAYDVGRRELAMRYYENTLDNGKNHYTAFLTLIELEKQLAARRGEPAPDYPEEALIMACEAAQMAADEGLTIEEQVATGFAMLRRRLGLDAN